MRTIIFTAIFSLCSAMCFAQIQITRPKPPKPASTTTTPEKPKPTPYGSPQITSSSSASNVSTKAIPSSSRLSGSDRIFTIGGVTFKMMKVEGGTFSMGGTYSREKPIHQVTLSSYYIGETEVTQVLWKAVMGSNPSDFKGDNFPVESISWNGCQEFIKKLNSITGENFRLPTEAEWEFAARGGNNSRGYQYSGSNNLSEVAWYEDNSDSQTHEVKSKSPNELGIYDMSGNVNEWSQDRYGSYSSNPVTNPTGSASGSMRVERGGGWSSNARQCRLVGRFGIPSFSQGNGLGLRLAL